MKLQRKIEKQDREAKRNDIIFPIIVPENMSESGTLMATILGMLGGSGRGKREGGGKEREKIQWGLYSENFSSPEI